MLSQKQLSDLIPHTNRHVDFRLARFPARSIGFRRNKTATQSIMLFVGNFALEREDTMLRTTLAAISIVAFTSSHAFASHCPADAAAITAALENVTVSEEIQAQVIELRDAGMVAHEAGNHDEAEATLAEAMRLLLNSIGQ
jgi:hypothetical protein